MATFVLAIRMDLICGRDKVRGAIRDLGASLAGKFYSERMPAWCGGCSWIKTQSVLCANVVRDFAKRVRQCGCFTEEKELAAGATDNLSQIKGVRRNGEVTGRR